MEWMSNSNALLVKSAEFEAMYSLSIADAWIAECAVEQGAVLLHKDLELRLLPMMQQLLRLKVKN